VVSGLRGPALDGVPDPVQPNQRGGPPSGL